MITLKHFSAERGVFLGLDGKGLRRLDGWFVWDYIGIFMRWKNVLFFKWVRILPEINWFYCLSLHPLGWVNSLQRFLGPLCELLFSKLTLNLLGRIVLGLNIYIYVARIHQMRPLVFKRVPCYFLKGSNCAKNCQKNGINFKGGL